MELFIEKYFSYFIILQVIHSQEEIWTNFQKEWPVWKMSRKTFVLCEIMLTIFLLLVFYWKNIPFRFVIMITFNLLMFANSIWHIMWAFVKKGYIPGLISSPLILIAYLFYYYKLILVYVK